jgi:hypothetical protein
MRLPDSHKFSVLLEAVGIFDLAAVRVCQLLKEPGEEDKGAMRTPEARHLDQLTVV